jgi:dTDP-4-dehydrorhamnose 3,5-epimerase
VSVARSIPGVRVERRQPHADGRGRFLEVLRARDYPQEFVQSNHSRSQAGVLRGLHYHTGQADLWYVVAGTAQVALVDLRERGGRPAVMVFELSEAEPSTLYIPAGVAHGFVALTDVDLLYWVTREFDSSDEHGIAWNDPTLAVPWAIDDPVLSDRDSSNPLLRWDQIPSFS